jgi:oxepin-CoA hydrolase/3-oxo-5,6-dehydrosuberyl-CoA semialdehyde dehydrogenase
MQRFQNYILGQWVDGQGVETPLFNAITGAQIGEASSAGIDFSSVLAYGRPGSISKEELVTYLQMQVCVANFQIFLIM